MVHALHEAQRVLQPNGILFDLRPAPVHRRVGIQSLAGVQEIGAMREDLTDDYFANRAVKQVLREGLFKSEKFTQFNCNRVMDSLKEFQTWLLDFTTLGRERSSAHDWLSERVERTYQAIPGKKKIIVHSPLILRRLRNLGG
jgi:hypothetical protein